MKNLKMELGIKLKYCLFFIMITNISLAQNYCIYYSLQTKLIPTDSSSTETYVELQKSCDEFTATLHCVSNNSEYTTNVKEIGVFGNNYYCVNNSLYYKTEKEILHNDYLISKSKINNWEFIEEFKEIAKHKCRKAILKDDSSIIAWIFEEQNSNYGPAQYFASNGVILELETTAYIITATQVKFSTKKEIILPKLEILDQVTYEKKIDDFFLETEGKF
jgi:GLPGLI family protein